MSRHNRYNQRDTRDIKCKKGLDCWYLFNSTCQYYHPKWQVQQARQYKRQQQERERRRNDRQRRNRSRSRSGDRRRRRQRRSRSSSRGYSRDRSSRDSRGSSSWQSRHRQSRTPERRRSRSPQRRQTIIVQNPQIIPNRPNFLSPQDYDRHIASLSSPDHEFAKQFEPKSKDGDDQFVDNLLENLRKNQPKQVQKPSRQHWSTQHLQAQLDSDQIKKEYPRAYTRYLQIVAQQDHLYARIFNNYFVRLQDQADQEDEQEWIRQYQEWMMGVDVGNEEDYMFFIENIRKYKLKDMTREQRQHHNSCPICMQSFVDSDADQNVEIGHLYCNHVYHKNCILQYLNPPEKWNQAAQKNLVNRHPKCPLCKKDFRDHDDYKEFDPNYKDRINAVQSDD